MLSKFLSVVAVLLFFTACSTTTAGKGSSTDASNSIADMYDVASQNLEPFTDIPGSKVGAKASDRVFFDFDSAVLSSRAQRTLDRQAGWLKKHSDVKFNVEGHCDERGTREYNIALGERRAAAVKNYLVNSGVDASRISTVSYGKERPAVTGSNESAWAENRRSVTVLSK